MILVIIIVVAWIVILTPSVIKRRSSLGEIGSISHFHRQLRVLENSGPEPIVTPAYRLRAVDGSGGTNGTPGNPEVTVVPVLSVVGASQLPRPALAFLGDDPVAEPAGPSGDRHRLPAMDHDPRPSERWTPGSAVEAGLGAPGRMSAAEVRFRVRRRRRDTLAIMAAFVVGTLAIGFVPGASTAWILTALSAVALAAYVALLVHLRRMAEEREQKLRYLRPDRSVRPEPAAGMGDPIPISGRYAHPSYQTDAAH